MTDEDNNNENNTNENNTNENNTNDEIIFRVFSLENDEICNELGKAIGIKYSREFLKVAGNEELNLKEIAKRIENNDNPRLPNPTHHKNRLERIGLIISKLKPQRKKGHKLNFIKGVKIIVIVRDDDLLNLVKDNKEIKSIFSRILKLSLTGIIPLFSYFFSSELLSTFDRTLNLTSGMSVNIPALTISLVIFGTMLFFNRKSIRNN